jgi:hypothetical protein
VGRLTDVVLDEFEGRVSLKMSDVFAVTGDQVVERSNIVALG